RVRIAAKRVQTREGKNLYRYPQEHDWPSLDVDSRLLNSIKDYLATTRRGITALVGPHGCGKTFALLYLGHWWEKQEYPKTVAYYAPAPSTLDLRIVKDHWTGIGQKRRCLWLIDNVHSDQEGIVEELIDEFED